MTLNPRSLLPHRVPSSTSTRSYKSNTSKGASLPPVTPRVLFEVDNRKYDNVVHALLFPIAETRSHTKSPPQRLIQDVKSLLLKSRASKRNRAKVSAAVRSLIQNAPLYKSPHLLGAPSLSRRVTSQTSIHKK